MVQNVSGCFYPKKVELNTGNKVDIRRWSAAANRLVVKSDNAKSANEYFNILEGHVNNAHTLLLRLEHEVTADKIKWLV